MYDNPLYGQKQNVYDYIDHSVTVVKVNDNPAYEITEVPIVVTKSNEAYATLNRVNASNDYGADIMEIKKSHYIAI